MGISCDLYSSLTDMEMSSISCLCLDCSLPRTSKPLYNWRTLISNPSFYIKLWVSYVKVHIALALYFWALQAAPPPPPHHSPFWSPFCTSAGGLCQAQALRISADLCNPFGNSPPMLMHHYTPIFQNLHICRILQFCIFSWGQQVLRFLECSWEPP